MSKASGPGRGDPGAGSRDGRGDPVDGDSRGGRNAHSDARRAAARTRSGANGPSIGSFNRAVVLDTIRRADPLSRVEIAEQTGLTAQTVTNIVRRLIDEGLVIEAGQTSPAVGKPRTLLHIAPGAVRSLGVHLGPTHITFAIVDLNGEVVSSHSIPLPDGGPQVVIAAIAARASQVIAELPAPQAVIGVGVASPGSVDMERGEIVTPPHMPGWDRVPLRDRLAEALGLPVEVDNDATASAIGERWIGRRARSGPFVFIYQGVGVGSGIMLAEGLYRGASGNAGEIGHISVDPRGPQCHCGNIGCLELFLTPAALRADPERAAAYFAQAMVGIVNVIDTEMLVLGGDELGPILPLYLVAVRDALASRNFARGVHTVRVEPSIAGEDAGAIGAASLILDARFTPRLGRL